jgi:3',5'-cyclic AMP phosphodiesterase CpdA
MNVIMYEPSVAALKAELEALEAEGIDFALIAGDMANSGTRGDFELLASVLDAVELPVYGCVGNHDSYHSSSRPEMLELVPELFPGGDFNYAFERGPLRFVVLDASYWRNREGEINDFYERGNYVGIGLQAGQVQWLRETLAADTRTPTLVMWHYGFYDRLGESSCGHTMRASTCVDSAEVRAVLEEAPNVVATLSGHSHWNQVNVLEGLTHLQNPAFAEWPNAYRALRVYDDRIEWEVRQVGNRGLVREAFIVEKAQSWMISTGPGDLAGEIRLER